MFFKKVWLLERVFEGKISNISGEFGKGYRGLRDGNRRVVFLEKV